MASAAASGWRTPALLAASNQRSNCRTGSRIDVLFAQRLRRIAHAAQVRQLSAGAVMPAQPGSRSETQHLPVRLSPRAARAAEDRPPRPARLHPRARQPDLASGPVHARGARVRLQRLHRRRGGPGRRRAAHREADDPALAHQELYFVAAGRATFTIDGDSHDAPAGTYVFIPDPASHRHAVATEPGTTVLSFGGPPTFEPSPWEWAFRAAPLIRSDPARAREILAEGLERTPGSPSLHYNLACLEAVEGRRDRALAELVDGDRDPTGDRGLGARGRRPREPSRRARVPGPGRPGPESD